MSNPRPARIPFFLWLRLVVAWLARPKLVWFVVGVVAISVWVGIGFFHSEKGVRITGLILEMLGIAIAATGIRDTRREFEKPGFFEQAKAWLLSFPSTRRRFISAHGSSGLVNFSAEASGEVWRGGGKTIESRVKALEENLDTVRASASATDVRTRNESRDLRQILQAETSHRTQGLAEIRKKLESANTGGLGLAITGVWFLAVGLIFSTVPQELCDFATNLGFGSV